MLRLLACFVCSAAAAAALSAPLPPIRGVPLSLLPEYHKAADQSAFGCLDGSAYVGMEHVNDNYCDCADGSDEPGTSACTDGKFYCTNKGHHGKDIPSAHVDDSVCDCCDGSDEPDGACPDTCAHENAEWRQAHAASIKEAEDGAAVKAQWVAEAEKTLAGQQAVVDEAQQALDDAEDALFEAQRVQEEAEAAEAELRGAHNTDAEDATALHLGMKNFPPSLMRSVLFALVRRTRTSDDLIALLNEQFASELEPLPTPTPSPTAPVLPPMPDSPEGIAAREAEAAAAAAAAREEAAALWDDDLEQEPEEVVVDPNPAGLQWVDTADPAWISDDKARAAQDLTDAKTEVELKKRDLQDARDAMKEDYGPNHEWLVLKGECIRLRVQKYTYEVCPFDKAQQDMTNLGRWGGFADNYTVMKFEDGQTCWGGPRRSLTLSLECGAKNELMNVQEPSTCVYTATLKTPAACNLAHAQELNVELTDTHDEL